MSTRITLRRGVTAIVTIGVVLQLAAADAASVRIVQTSSAGDRVYLIDPATNKVAGEILDIEVNHGAVPSPDGTRIYVTNEADVTLDVADTKTLKVIKKVPLTGHPNNLSVSKDGRKV